MGLFTDIPIGICSRGDNHRCGLAHGHRNVRGCRCGMGTPAVTWLIRRSRRPVLKIELSGSEPNLRPVLKTSSDAIDFYWLRFTVKNCGPTTAQAVRAQLRRYWVRTATDTGHDQAWAECVIDPQPLASDQSAVSRGPRSPRGCSDPGPIKRSGHLRKVRCRRRRDDIDISRLGLRAAVAADVATSGVQIRGQRQR